MFDIKRRFRQNPGLKLISLFTGFMLWIAVINLSNPEVNEYETLTLNVRNGDVVTAENQVYSLENETVVIGYTVRTLSKDKVSNSDFEAYVDFEDLSVTGALPVYVDISDKALDVVSDVSIQPIVTHVHIEDYKTMVFNVGARYNGKPASGFVEGKLATEPGQITVGGPASKMSRIASADISLDINSATSDVSGEADVTLYDAEGKEIKPEGLTFDPHVSFRLPVYPSKLIPVTVRFNGEPADDYKLDSTEVIPSMISVHGSESDLESVSELVVVSPEIDISGADSDVHFTADAQDYLPDGVYLSDEKVSLSITAKITRIPEPEFPGEHDRFGEVGRPGSDGLLFPDMSHTEETTAESTQISPYEKKGESVSGADNSSSSEDKISYQSEGTQGPGETDERQKPTETSSELTDEASSHQMSESASYQNQETLSHQASETSAHQISEASSHRTSEASSHQDDGT